MNPLECFFGIKGHAALDGNPGSGYNTILLRLIPGDLYSVCPHRQFNTLPSLLHSQAALPNSNPNTCMWSREAVDTILWQFLEWPSWGVNQWPTAWEVDKATTKSSPRGVFHWLYSIRKDSQRLGWSDWLEEWLDYELNTVSTTYLGQEYNPHFFESETHVVLAVFFS